MSRQTDMLIAEAQQNARSSSGDRGIERSKTIAITAVASAIRDLVEEIAVQNGRRND